RLEVIVIRLANAAEEAHGAGPPKLEMQHAQHKTLSLENFFGGIARVHHVDDLLNRRAVYLFVLGCYEESGGTNELELPKRDDLDREETINAIDSKEESLWEEAKPVVHLDQPVH